jgi:hypothetical protein
MDRAVPYYLLARKPFGLISLFNNLTISFKVMKTISSAILCCIIGTYAVAQMANSPTEIEPPGTGYDMVEQMAMKVLEKGFKGSAGVLLEAIQSVRTAGGGS